MTARSVWTNPDGLRVAFGTNQAKGALVSATSQTGPYAVAEAILEASDLVIGGGQIDPDANVVFPAGTHVLRATLLVTETFVSATTNGTLDLGFSILDGTYTGLDEDGIDVAIAEAALVAGARIDCDGALVTAGTSRALTVAGYLSYDVDVAVFTAGKARLIVEFVVPNYPDQNSTN